MIDEGISDFLLQLRNEIIQIQRTQVFRFAAYRNFVFLFLFIADNDLIRETVLAVVADFVTDFSLRKSTRRGSLPPAIWQQLPDNNLPDFR